MSKNLTILIAGLLFVAGCGKSGDSKANYQPRKTTNGYTGTGGSPQAPQVPQVPRAEERSADTLPRLPKDRLTDENLSGADAPAGVESKNEDFDLVLEGEDSVPEKLREDYDIDNSQVEVLGNAHQCGEAYKTTEQDWMPGTLFPPAQTPIFTGGESPRGYKYTDSHDDSVMAILAEDFRRRVTGCRIKPSLELAQRISHVDVYTDIYDKGEARVTFELFDGSVKGQARSQKQKIVIHMMGSFGGKMTATRQPRVDENGKLIVNLVQTNKAKEGLRFRGYLGCLDADFGCQTTVLVLEQLTKEGKVCRTAFAVHRNGNAHITMHREDREYGRLNENSNYSIFANYLANTADAACFQNLREIENEVRRGMPQCAINRMKQQCAGIPIREPYARTVGMKTWSVLYGTAKFTFNIDDVLYVRGPLVYSKIRPVIESQRLQVAGSVGVRMAGVQRAYLVNNDGAGQLNFGLKFSGHPEAVMRITVSSLFKDSLYGNERLNLIKNVSAQTAPEEYITDEGQVVSLPGQPYDPDKEFDIDGKDSDATVDVDTQNALKGPRATQNDDQKK